MTELETFFHMGGYALYVWGSFGLTAFLMIVEPLMLTSRKKQVLSRVKRLIQMREEEKI